ncbi:hypothetical protein C8J57DRAFT_759570 [Mycena rebaudengoi]|nr:hypothetical protein C8J57DRAFT_759570 [Mycena rebaudengoi]
MEFILPYDDLRLLHGTMPLLRQLTIGPDEFSFFNGVIPGADGVPLPILFLEAPKLSSVILSDTFMPSALALPWAQLTSVVADALHLYECAEVLRHGTHLESVTFAMLEDPEEIDLQQIPPLIHLHSLVLLSHIDSAGHCQPPLLDALVLPGLRTLQISLQGFDILTDPRATITSLITRSSCRLESLCIRDALRTNVNWYRSALPSIPNITIVPVRDLTCSIPDIPCSVPEKSSSIPEFRGRF